jgi:dethiobiotin synthetase
MRRGCFITGSDTGVGKTVLAAAIVASLRSRGEAAYASKPLLTGVDLPVAGVPGDDELLELAGGGLAREIAPVRFGPAVSPHLAAELAGVEIDVPAILAGLRAAPRPLVVEGIGGLLVPIAEGWDVRRFAQELGLGVIIAARPALGTINHTLLTIEAARAGGLDLRAVVLTPWPADPGVLERSNRATIERLGSVAVATLEEVSEYSAPALAAAGSRLPYESWLE